MTVLILSMDIALLISSCDSCFALRKEIFSCAEIHNKNKAEELCKFTGVSNDKIIFSSDAHYLWDINEKEHYFELDDEPYSSSLVRKRLFDYLKGR